MKEEEKKLRNTKLLMPKSQSAGIFDTMLSSSICSHPNLLRVGETNGTVLSRRFAKYWSYDTGGPVCGFPVVGEVLRVRKDKSRGESLDAINGALEEG